ncbi:hypothetical protein E2C01_083354 [Portunus trituberculatus]|uniref:Uncharacterized protein n=1 Tax=Portunus trituberculatus TaxID=210409 RepID=A0A5B7IS82_PORTR|nr:hypothetical protein [Portunus trituberculatus]
MEHATNHHQKHVTPMEIKRQNVEEFRSVPLQHSGIGSFMYRCLTIAEALALYVYAARQYTDPSTNHRT